MHRNLESLTSREYDLIVIGGGIVGICCAWDAALRGLSVALIERSDFANASSANCFKMVHGGIRYLQHADVARVRQSARERSILLQIAPHLVRPLPILIPTYGHGLKGKEVLATGLKAYDLLTFDRNRGARRGGHRIPATQVLSRREVLQAFPDLDTTALSGGGLFGDAQMYSPARLALAFLQSAVERGADAANYAEVTGFLKSGQQIIGVEVRDRLADEAVEIRGRCVLNAAGGWSGELLRRLTGADYEPPPVFSRDAYFVVRRSLHPTWALAVSGQTRDPDALFNRSARHLFLVPWRNCTLVGVWHRVHQGDPSRTEVTPDELAGFVDEINSAYPGLSLTSKDAVMLHGGRVLTGDNQPGTVELSFGKRARLVDHAKAHGLPGFVSLIGVRYTTARSDARPAVDAIFRKLGHKAPECRTASTSIRGGEFESLERLQHEASRRYPTIPVSAMNCLIRNHGRAYGEVLNTAPGQADLFDPVEGTDTLRAEVVHAVRSEMAQTLSDVVFRRTDLGTAGHPGPGALEVTADLMAAELGWTAQKRADEVAATLAEFPTLDGEAEVT